MIAAPPLTITATHSSPSEGHIPPKMSGEESGGGHRAGWVLRKWGGDELEVGVGAMSGASKNLLKGLTAALQNPNR